MITLVTYVYVLFMFKGENDFYTAQKWHLFVALADKVDF